MPRDRKGGAGAGVRKPPESRAPHRWIVLLPVLLVLVLNLPCIDLGYFWDDFYCLSFQDHGGLRAHLLPAAQGTFYRPIPLGVYFKILALLDPRNGALGHLLNLAALVGTVVLLVTLVSRLCGPRAGLFSGLLFASYGNVPGPVAWISGSQDLFAMLFVVAAFLLRQRGKDIAALACAAAGVLCKEPAIAAFPVLLLWDRILGRPPRRPVFQIVGYGLVALLWGVIHPGIHLLAGRGFKSGATMYVGLEHSERWGLYLWRYLLTLINVPPPGLAASWWENRAAYGIAALVMLIAGLVFLARQKRLGTPPSCSLARVGMISALFVIPGLLMPTILVRHWAPYFACLPALGVALFLGPVLARRGAITATLALSIFLLLGVWYRGARAEEESILTDRAVRIMEGLTRIEPAELGAYNRRMIASMLLAAGRRKEADSALAATPPFPRNVALALVFGLMADPSPSERLDDAAFEAFGLSARDPEVLRTLMLGFERNASLAQAAWFARRLRQLSPGDSSSAEILTRAAREGITPRREPSMPAAGRRAEGG